MTPPVNRQGLNARVRNLAVLVVDVACTDLRVVRNWVCRALGGLFRFEDVGHSKSAREQLKDLYIGDLKVRVLTDLTHA